MASTTPGAPAPPTSLAEIRDRLHASGIDAELLKRFTAHRDLPATPDLLPLTPLTLAAATRGCFLPSNLSGEVRTADQEQTDLLMARCDVMPAGAQRGWQLREPVRRALLLEAREQGLLAASVKHHEPYDALDGEGPLLRRVLSGETPDPQRMPLEELTNLATVSQWLAGTDLARIPEPDALRRLIGTREILDPFRALTGRRVDAGSDGSGDRVVGRADEMEQMRAYVGVIKPEELHFYASRLLDNVWSALTRRDPHPPLLIRGIGGMGKSTLIAKFILDHALIPGVPLPFVYLDFDRAALAPRQPLQLLIEMAVQLGRLFPPMERALKPLREELRGVIDSQGRNANRVRREGATSTELKSFCGSLRDIVERFTEGRSPVLVVFDTFEVVQYDEEAVSGVTSLIAALRNPDGEGWSALRLVVAGRGDLDDIETSVKPVTLKRLTRKATAQLLSRRSASEALALTDREMAALAPALTNSPLDVMVVTRWLKDREPAERRGLIEDLVSGLEVGEEGVAGEQGARGDELAALRVTGILTRRMIDHIKDPHVRALAFPGLVVRAVTALAIREVMAPASGVSTAEKPLPAGAEFELHRRLSREQWLVMQQGKVLRHRPEVRRAMVALMRRKDRAAFERTNDLALNHFLPRAGKEPEARAETVYHMLLGGRVPLQDVDAWWSPSIATTLASAVDDLGQREQAYLKARLGRRVPTPKLMALPGPVLTRLLASHGAGYMRSLGPDPVIDLIHSAYRKLAPSGLSSTPRIDQLVLGFRQRRTALPLEGLRTEALYRAGQWTELRDIALVPYMPVDFESSQGAAHGVLRFMLRWATREPEASKSEAFRSGGAPWHIDPGLLLSSPSLVWDYATWLACASRREPNRRSLPAHVMGRIAAYCRADEPLPAVAADSDAVRLLAFFDKADDMPLLRRVDFDNHFATVSGPEIRALRALMDRGPRGAISVPLAWPRDDAYSLLRKLEGRASNTVFAEPETTRQFAAVIRKVANLGTAGNPSGVLATLSLKHPDWLQPLGHALKRAFGNEVPRKIGLLDSIDKYFGSSGKPRRSRPSADGEEILALADEASCLPEAVAEYTRLLAREPTVAANDFLRLSAAFDAWRKLLQALMPPDREMSP